MKKFLLTLGCALLGASAFSAEPLVKNGSFENGLTGWVVPSWIKNAAKPQLDNSDMPGAGTASLKMVAADGKLPIIYQVVRFPAGVSQYKVSFKAKTEKFSNWGFVILYISSDKAKKRCFEKVISAQHGVKNSIPWTTYQGVLNVPAEAMNGTGKVTIQFGSKVTGTAWFDDLTIEPVQATPPAPAKVNEKQQPAPAKADAGKKKINTFFPGAVDSDFNLMRSHWELISWIPDIDFTGSPTLDFSGEVAAGKVLAFMQRCMSVHTNCDGPFRFSTWIKTAQAATPHVAISTFPQVYSNKKGNKSFVIRPTGKVRDGFREFAGDFITPDNTAELRVAVRTLKPQATPLAVEIKNSQLRPIVIPGEKIELFQINSRGKQGLFLPEETPEAELVFRNSTSKPAKLTMQCSVYDYFGKKVKDFSCQFDLPAMRFSRCPVKLENLQKNGFYAVDCQWQSGGFSGKTDFSIVKVTLPPASPNRTFGITFMADTHERNAQAMHRLGVGTKGVRMAWREIERPDGSYDWSAIDQAVEACVRNNIKIIGGFEIFSDHIPKKYREAAKSRPGKTVDEKFDAAYFDAARKFELTAQKRYQKHIKEWAYIAEIDLLRSIHPYEADHYVKRICHAAPALRQQQPGMILTAIGCSGGDGRSLPRYRTLRMLWQRLHDQLDGVSLDQYTAPSNYGPGNQPVDSESGMLREMMLEAYKIISANGKTFLSIDEKGPHITYNLAMNNEYARNMANVVARDYIIVKSLPVKHWLYYGWNRWRDGGSLDYGLWKKASPRHTVSAYAATARLLNGVEFIKKADLHKNLPVYIFKKQNQTLVALWRSGNGKDITALIDLPAKSVLLDVEGNAKNLPAGKNTLTLTDAPIYLLSSASASVMEKCLKNASVTLPEIKMAMSMLNCKNMAVYLNNLTNQNLNLKCQLNRSTRQITLPPQAIKRVIMPIAAAKQANLTVKTDKGFTYTLQEEIENIPVKRVKNPDELKNSAPTFVLDKAELHLNNIDFAANLHYTGKKDCSAEVRMGYDKSNLYLHVRITDDIHVNEQTRSFMTWAGDCIQFAFDPLHDAKLKQMQGKSGLCDDDLLFTAAKVFDETRMICDVAPNAEKVKMTGTIIRDDQTKTTVYTIAIPLKQIPVLKVKPGTVFGFNLIVMDCDEPGGTSKYWMQLTPGIAGGQKPYIYKSFIFE